METPPMDDFARSLLEAFALSANLSVGLGSLHPNDWRRFHEFIIHVHRRALPITDRDVSNALFGAGVGRETATELGGRFAQGRELLRLYEGTK